MDNIPLGLLILALIICLSFSAFFSASETAMMSLNRYKLKHLADEGNKRAKCASHLLKHTDRLIGTILLGNNFVNIAATSLGTLIGLRLYGDLGVLLSTIILTVVVLVFSEVAPKTLAATNAQRIALPVAPVLAWLVRILSPLVRLLNAIVRLILRPLGIKTENAVEEALSNDELRSIVQSSQNGDDEESSEQQDMLLNVLELEDVSVSEAMVPRNELEGVDLNDDWEDILRQITSSRHGRLVAYRDHLDQAEGMLHIRDIILPLRDNTLDKTRLQQVLRPCHFVPESTPLRKQLLHFRQAKARSGLVVDEYGDIKGLVTLEDILEEIVGDFTTSNTPTIDEEVMPQSDGSMIIEGSANLRDLNKMFHWNLDTEDARTFNGLILEHLEEIPEEGTVCEINGLRITILEVGENMIKQAKVVKL